MPESYSRSGSRTTPVLLTALLITLSLLTGLVGLASPADAAAMRTARAWYRPAIEPLAAYQAQTTCSPRAKPGVADFAARLLRANPSTRSMGIVRACGVGVRSEHKEGRAFDWGGLDAGKKADRVRVQRFLRWLLAKDKFGNKHAMARRLGVQYVIWNRRIWGSYAADAGWRPYRGASPHRDHVHISFTWAGARAKTSFWTGKVGNVGAAPRPAPLPTLPPRPTVPRPTTPTVPRPTVPPAPPVVPPRPVPAPAGALLPGPALLDETLTVPAGAGTALTTGALQQGQTYLVEVSGTYAYGSQPGQVADAECSTAATDSSWRRTRSVHPAQPREDHLDLYVDGVDLYADADVDGGGDCDLRTHTYRDTLTPSRTGRVTLELWDPTTPADNSGALTVRIIAVAPRPELRWQVPATAAAGVTSPGALEAGVTYLMTVTGTVDAGNGVTADAECSVSTADGVWQRDRSLVSTAPTADHLDLLLDRRDMTFRPVSDSDGDGCDTDGHAYRLVLTPNRTWPANLRVDDPDWTDNAGELSVHVQRVDPPVGTETVTVDTSAADVETRRSYLAGKPLLLSAAGSYAIAPGTTADAECSATAADPTWRATRSTLYAGGRYLGDVTVDGRGDWVGPGGARCDPTTHTYTWTYTPDRTGPLLLGVADHDRSDNSGTVTVTISPATG
ncbi:MAG TPA: hypothetical protein VFV76_08440 [Actinomycetes bacterium]|nr:hypothetical protein [Actinomycetes bacterium]